MLGILGVILGLYLRSIQQKPIRYLTLADLLNAIDFERNDIAVCPPEILNKKFELKQVILQNLDFSRPHGVNGYYKLHDGFGMSYTLSERSAFVDKDRAHIAFLVRPELSQKCYWLILKGPLWSELNKQGMALQTWYHKHELMPQFERRYLTRPL